MADGDAGKNFLQHALGQPDEGNNPWGLFEGLGEAQQVAAGAQHLLDAANDGGFSINEEGGQAYIDALEQFRLDLMEVQSDAKSLANSPCIGDGHYAKEVSDFIRQAFDGDDQSLLPVLNQLHRQIDKAHQAFLIARDNYRQADSENDQRFKAFDGATGD